MPGSMIDRLLAKQSRMDRILRTIDFTNTDGGEQDSDAYIAFKKRYQFDCAAFAQECIVWGPNEGLTVYQIEIMEALVKHRRICVRGPHGLGKTALASIIVLWYALTRDGLDWKIPTTASVYHQLTQYLWPEIHKWAARLRWDVIGRRPFREGYELKKIKISLDTGEAFAISPAHLQIEEGPADVLIPYTAKRLNAALTILGTVARTGLAGVLIGNTAEGVLDALDSDVLVLKPADIIHRLEDLVAPR